MAFLNRMEITHRLFPKGHTKLLLDWFDDNNITWVWDINDRLFIWCSYQTFLIYRDRIKSYWQERFNIELNNGIFVYV